MSNISTHILDTATGKPAGDVAVTLEYIQGQTIRVLASARTNNDGRIRDWGREIDLEVGDYAITFDCAEYFERRRIVDYFYPEVRVRFRVTDDSSHYHVPLLLSPFGFSTYRGS